MQFQQIRGATSIVTYGGQRFLVDPFFAPRGSCPPVPSPYNDLPNPLVELPLPVEAIIAVDAVIVTHIHHFDHFDAHAAQALPKEMPIFVQSEKEAGDMRALGFCNVTPLAAEGVRFGAVELYRTQALHGDGVTAAYYYRKFALPAEACGFVLRAPGEKAFYAAGDTLWFDGVQRAIEAHRPPGVYLRCGYPDLGAKAEAEAVRKARRAVAEYIGTIHREEETPLMLLALGDDRIGMMGAMVLYMTDGLIYAINHLHRTFKGEELRMVVILARGDSVLEIRKRALIRMNDDIPLGECRGKARQERIGYR